MNTFHLSILSINTKYLSVFLFLFWFWFRFFFFFFTFWFSFLLQKINCYKNKKNHHHKKTHPMFKSTISLIFTVSFNEFVNIFNLQCRLQCENLYGFLFVSDPAPSGPDWPLCLGVLKHSPPPLHLPAKTYFLQWIFVYVVQF